MSLLKQLEQAAEQRKRAETEQSQAAAERERVYRETVEPAMQRLHDYLQRLTKTLAELKTERIQTYELPGYGPVRAQIQHEYQLASAQQTQARELKLSFHAAVLTDQCPLIEVHGQARIQTIQAAFQKLGIPGLKEAKKDANGQISSGSFQARGKVPLTMQAQAELGTGMIKLSFVNFQNLGTTSKVYSPAQLNEELFDLIGRYIAREDDELFKENLPEKYRQSLKHKVQQDLMKRKWEERLQAQIEEEKRRQQEQQTLAHKLQKATTQAFEKLKVTLNQWLDRGRKSGGG